MPLPPFCPIASSFTVEGSQFELGSLPVGIVRYKILPLTEALVDGSKTLQGSFEEILGYVVASMQVVDPAITQEALLESRSMSEIIELFYCVLKVSGMRRKDAEGEAERAKS